MFRYKVSVYSLSCISSYCVLAEDSGSGIRRRLTPLVILSSRADAMERSASHTAGKNVHLYVTSRDTINFRVKYDTSTRNEA